MNLRFRIHYQTSFGQSLFVSGSMDALGNSEPAEAIPMTYLADGLWELKIEIPDTTKEFSYQYWLGNSGEGASEQEFALPRQINFSPNTFQTIEIRDEWFSSWEEQNALLSSAFSKALMKRPAPARKGRKPKSSHHRFQLLAPGILPGQGLFLSGNAEALGNWDPEKAVPMSAEAFPIWSAQIPLKGNSSSVEYKYLIKDLESGEVIRWETGSNRKTTLVPSRREKKISIQTENFFRTEGYAWRGAGMAIPVFSLRSEAGAGVGEFSDLPALVDWAKATGMNLVQILPINDTTATHSWKDCYPYAAISVFALHPIYLRIPEIAAIKDPILAKEFEAESRKLNALDSVEFEQVMKLKSRFLKVLFDQEKAAFMRSKAAKAFLAENEDWLLPYAAFSYLRDQHQTADFSQWKKLSKYQAKKVQQLCDPSQKWHDDIAIHYFIQYHLHQQLSAATDYAREAGVVLKGDLPIGIYRHSVDAWMAPDLYHMDGQAGAPPDDFAVAGQNWRFPTYNWEKMAEDGFAWWKQRMTHLAQYFDAFRIDHILGFFRIWEIPEESVQGIMGQFNPCLPISVEEFRNWGIWWAEQRFTQPYIRQHFLSEYLGEYAEPASREFLEEYDRGAYRFKSGLETQRAIEGYLEDRIRLHPDSQPYYEAIQDGLYGLLAEVLFFPVKGGGGYSPRVAMQHTRSFQELDPHTKTQLNRLYDHFYYHRHDQFWREQAMVKLPAITRTTDMLICGEDLGMVPASVPGVMRELGLLSLEIQRMPKDSSKAFGHPAEAPYLSVVSTSTHDMSTIRGWWEEDPEATQRFFQQILGHTGEAPFFCEPWIAEDIIQQHLFSPAMWAILPIQDFLAMDTALRKEDPHSEQINIPAKADHYWRYRLHLSLTELLSATAFNERLASLVRQSGRGA